MNDADWTRSLQIELADLETANRLRRPLTLHGPAVTPSVDADEALVSFCSNDYLGIASHPALAAAAAACPAPFGAAASRLVSGQHPEHLALERDLASFLHRPAALLFPTGYQTNLGVLTALASRDDLIVSDAANHASLIDGCRLSRATVVVYAHNDAADAGRVLTAHASRAYRRRLIVTESVFSMDGDAAPLRALASLADAHGALLIVDEAHALGVLGPGGRGLCAETGVSPHVLVGTLGKAFGTFGGFASGLLELRDVLLNRARTFVFTTAPPPPLAAASRAAIETVASADGELRRVTLRAHLRHLRERLDLPPSDSPIIPLLLGTERRALEVSKTLRSRGFLAQAIRPPTVPIGTSRLRITLSAAHTNTQIEDFAAALRSSLTP